MTSWWNKNAESRINDFKSWVGDSNLPSKVYCRNYIADKKYSKLIDCGCGLASEYFGFKQDNYDISYTGLDSCQHFVELNRSHGISMIEAELETDFPIADSSYECVYCREVIEHLSHYEKAVSEMIRIASKEVIIVWFIPPADEEKINYWEEEDLYHNTYSKEKFERFLMRNKKVENFFWETVDDMSNRKDVVDAALKDKELDTTLEEGQSESIERPMVKLPKMILHILIKGDE